mmetsp:Transcript_10455/g.30356  ORF Transcript_10455/g.30356 Transcript_10455/m.30356 type:complete len:407 (+) Transcript_10455:203-1423(+)
MRFVLVLDLQHAIIAESHDIEDHRAPNDTNPRLARQFVYTEERQEQRQEDEGGLVEVSPECSRRGRQRVHDRELNNVVQEREYAGEHEPCHRGLIQGPDALQDLEVRHRRSPEDLRPHSRHGLLHEHGDGQQKERRRYRHIRDGVINVQLRLPEHARQREIERAAEQRAHAHEHAKQHIRRLRNFVRVHGLLAPDPGPRENDSTDDANRHQADLLRAAWLAGVQSADGQALLRQERGERQARPDNQVHRDANVPQTEIVQRDVEGEDAAEDDHTKNIEGRVQLFGHIAVGREVDGREEEQKHTERNYLLHRSKREACRTPGQRCVEHMTVRKSRPSRHGHRRAHDPAHVDIHEGLRAKVEHELANGSCVRALLRRDLHHHTPDDQPDHGDHEGPKCLRHHTFNRVP